MSKADRHSEALLGIHLAKTRGRPEGSPPSDEELALMIEGQLSEERRQEVLSHLASRPERYRQWLSLADMDADEKELHAGLLSILAKGINNWLIDWRYAAGGVGAMAAVLLLVNQMALPPADYAEEALAEAESSADLYSPAREELKDMQSAPAKPSPLAAARQQQSKMEMAEDRAQSSQRLMAAKRMASSPPSRCLTVSNPATQLSGLLCAAEARNDYYELQWTAENEFDAQPLIKLPAKPLHILASGDKRWLAVQSVDALYVFALESVFKAEINRVQLPFAAETARMRWDKNELLISVLQALGDSDDDLLYRYNPETGEVQPAPP